MSPAQRSKFRRALACGREVIECHYCGKRLYWFGMTLDHVVPRAAGGSDDLSNLVLCCCKCNRKKGALPYAAFVQQVAA